MAIVESLKGDRGAETRWRLALAGIDRLLADLALPPAERLDVLERMQASFAREHRVDARLKKQMSTKLRVERRGLEKQLQPAPEVDAGADPAIVPGLAALERRSRQLEPIVAELRERQQAGRLTTTLPDLARSYVHMFTNRLLRSDARAQEMMLYDFLLRLEQSRAARRRAMGKGKR